MSSFEVKVRRLAISPHPDPETISLECGIVDGYRVVVLKGMYRTGDLAVYIPEGAIVPDPIIEEMGLTGRLAGVAHNRVKAIKLRGQLSQGLIYQPSPFPWAEGEEVGEALGIAKWEPPIPIDMDGKVEPCPSDAMRSYDVEDVKKYPGVLREGENVVITEKLHGTLCVLGVDGEVTWVSQKRYSGLGLRLVEDPRNVYWRAARQADIPDFDLLEKVRHLSAYLGEPVNLFGEVLGVQDLKYGLKKGEIAYRAFDIYAGRRGFLCHRAFDEVCDRFEIPTVPFLYEGPFSWAVLNCWTGGPSVLAGHIREGVVVRAEPKRFDPTLGRVVLKSISPAYLLRKGETTELQ
jgi:RNA ligase (TIGR02306 family)